MNETQETVMIEIRLELADKVTSVLENALTNCDGLQCLALLNFGAIQLFCMKNELRNAIQEAANVPAGGEVEESP